DAPTPAALKTYLAQFLGDPRVIEAPRLLWWFILHGSILRRRPAESAAKYQRIWNESTGSPLLHYTKRQVQFLREAMPNVPIEFGHAGGHPAPGRRGHPDDGRRHRPPYRPADVPAVFGYNDRFGNRCALRGAHENAARAGPAHRAAVL